MNKFNSEICKNIEIFNSMRSKYRTEDDSNKLVNEDLCTKDDNKKFTGWDVFKLVTDEKDPYTKEYLSKLLNIFRDKKSFASIGIGNGELDHDLFSSLEHNPPCKHIKKYLGLEIYNYDEYSHSNVGCWDINIKFKTSFNDFDGFNNYDLILAIHSLYWSKPNVTEKFSKFIENKNTTVISVHAPDFSKHRQIMSEYQNKYNITSRGIININNQISEAIYKKNSDNFFTISSFFSSTVDIRNISSCNKVELYKFFVFANDTIESNIVDDLIKTSQNITHNDSRFNIIDKIMLIVPNNKPCEIIDKLLAVSFDETPLPFYVENIELYTNCLKEEKLNSNIFDISAFYPLQEKLLFDLNIKGWQKIAEIVNNINTENSDSVKLKDVEQLFALLCGCIRYVDKNCSQYVLSFINNTAQEMKVENILENFNHHYKPNEIKELCRDIIDVGGDTEVAHILNCYNLLEYNESFLGGVYTFLRSYFSDHDEL